MAKKIKKLRGDISGRNREKLRRARVRLDKITLLLTGVAIVSMLLIWNKPYDLSTTGANGFPALFLLVLAGLPLEILESTFRFLEMPELVKVCGSFAALSCCAFFTIVVLWIYSRYAAVRRYGQSGIRIAATLLQIFAFWGMFQLFCFMVSSALEDSHDDSLKQHLKHDAKAKK